MTSPRVRVLHISGNFPDPSFVQPTTNAVSNLIDATREHLDHFVVSIKRVRVGSDFSATKEGMVSLAYGGLPALLGMKLTLRRLGERIATSVANTGFDYDVIHAHKLTVEGVVAQQLSIDSRKPYVTTLRGYTDGRMVRLRPDCRRLFRDALLGSRVVFLPAPWTAAIASDLVKERGGERHSLLREVVLPNIVSSSRAAEFPRPPPSRVRFATVFRAGQGANKGFQGVLAGLKALRAGGREVSVEVIGCAQDSPEGAMAARAGLQDAVRFSGVMCHEEALRSIAGSSALVLPSKNDTFGMAYVEALLSGVPVLYSARAGIDGYLDGLRIGVRVEPTSIKSIVEGMRELANELSTYHTNLQECLSQGRLGFFLKERIAETYVHAMRYAAANESTNPAEVFAVP